MKRTISMLALLALGAALPGCVFAVGSKLEAQPKERLDRLEERVLSVEQQLGIPAPPAAQQDVMIVGIEETAQ